MTSRATGVIAVRTESMRTERVEHEAPGRIHPARILYGVQGEGRGHATRSIEVIRALQEQGYTVKVLSGGDALPVLRSAGIEAIPIPMLRYHYGADGTLSPRMTLTSNVGKALGLFFRTGAAYRYVFGEAAAFAPDLCISDFEPYVSRVARDLRLPLVAIDHQHFLTETLLPRPRRLSKALALGMYQAGTWLLGGKPDRIITSSFWHFPRRPGSRALLVGPFLSSGMPAPQGDKAFEGGASLVVYLKRASYLRALLPALTAHGPMTVDVFSDWSSGSDGAVPANLPSHIRLRPIDRCAFLRALAGSQALVTTAGNQVLGEAIHLGKPTLAFPEPEILEQELNALALARSGMGEACSLQELSVERLDRFLEALPQYRRRLMNHRQSHSGYDGRADTLRFLRRMLKRQYLSWAHGPAPSPRS
jgi:UDP:flavonoid glycosyltransferase YjiC (YdhE family)